jgi:hypothetical protein
MQELLKILNEELAECERLRKIAVEQFRAETSNYWVGRGDGLELAKTLVMAKMMAEGQQ